MSIDETFTDLCDAADAAGWHIELDALAPATTGNALAAFRIFVRSRCDGHVLAATEWALDLHLVAVSVACKLLAHADNAVRDIVAGVRLAP